MLLICKAFKSQRPSHWTLCNYYISEVCLLVRPLWEVSFLRLRGSSAALWCSQCSWMLRAGRLGSGHADIWDVSGGNWKEGLNHQVPKNELWLLWEASEGLNLVAHSLGVNAGKFSYPLQSLQASIRNISSNFRKSAWNSSKYSLVKEYSCRPTGLFHTSVNKGMTLGDPERCHQPTERLFFPPLSPSVLVWGRILLCSPHRLTWNSLSSHS